MNQTRAFLLFAWLLVASLLWMEWTREKAAPPPATTSTATTSTTASVPTAVGPGAVPTAPGTTPTASATPAATAGAVTVHTDVLNATLDGGQMLQAELPGYPDLDDPTRPVRLFSTDPAHYFAAQSGWVATGAPAPTHLSGFVPAEATRAYSMAPGATTLDVPFVWTGANGVTIRRTYTFTRGSYAVRVHDEVVNAGTAPWQASVYRQLSRTMPEAPKGGFTSGRVFAFQGAAWYSPQDKYEKRAFNKFTDDGALSKKVTGGWIAFLQHHFFTAWIPQPGDATEFATITPNGIGGTNYVIREVGPTVNLAPGQKLSTDARLWVGPKSVEQIAAAKVPGLERAVDFSSYTTMATLAGWLYAVLAWLHGFIGNWGWSIIGLVVLIKLALLPLANAQYRSMAKMRRLQPKLQQLKERHGEDRQQFQQAMMELYRKEKVNPAGGCLPIFVQMPIFLALYWMLSESVELRHAPWMLWIHDLTARDPYFVLPVINAAVMFVTQKLTPTAGMDPAQAKMMQFMPLAFGVMFAFFPSGLVLYWVTNGLLTLAQQWYFLRKYGEPAKKN
ncbi:membrane protein insertase YidC [Lysobacter sp. TY2-98]|uniref:membrane protein insertase YidC n=1 Tax=Lysobacter sp. TY2-98 TaxID=2290922 RepID=UPI000E1FCEA4|nr:membrane protein insertase YidC [Lysobacter sp. TY2-98]AXK73207.1 membrane protein insertase YidC [Lysobacter sp. TY2-98]